MECVAADCLIRAKSIRKGATELAVHRQTLSEAMGRMKCCVTCNAMLKAAAHQTECDAQENTS